MFDHFDFLLDKIEFWFHRFAEIVSGILETLNRLSNLSSHFWQLFRAEEEERDD